MNMGLFEYMCLARDHGAADATDMHKMVLGHRVAVERGLMTETGDITDAGHQWMSNAPVVSCRILSDTLPPLVIAAMRDVIEGDTGIQEFERQQNIPARSGKVVVEIAKCLMV